MPIELSSVQDLGRRKLGKVQKFANIVLESWSATARPAKSRRRRDVEILEEKIASCVEEEGREGVMQQTLETGRILSSVIASGTARTLGKIERRC